MQDLNWDFSEISVFKFFLVVLFLFSGLWCFKLLIRRLPVKRSYKITINRYLPVLEGLIWLGFMPWGIKLLIEDSYWTSIGLISIVMIVLMMLSWFLARDYLAGIILKSEGSLNLNDWIKIKKIKGKVVSMGYRLLVLETEVGETVTIPYSNISGEVSIKPNPSEKVKSHAFKLVIPKDDNFRNARSLVMTTLLNAPWSSLKKKPQVKLLVETDTHLHLEAIIYAMRTDYFQKIKSHLKHHVPEISLANRGDIG